MSLPSRFTFFKKINVSFSPFLPIWSLFLLYPFELKGSPNSLFHDSSPHHQSSEKQVVNWESSNLSLVVFSSCIPPYSTFMVLKSPWMPSMALVTLHRDECEIAASSFFKSQVYVSGALQRVQFVETVTTAWNQMSNTPVYMYNGQSAGVLLSTQGHYSQLTCTKNLNHTVQQRLAWHKSNRTSPNATYFCHFKRAEWHKHNTGSGQLWCRLRLSWVNSTLCSLGPFLLCTLLWCPSSSPFFLTTGLTT